MTAQTGLSGLHLEVLLSIYNNTRDGESWNFSKEFSQVLLDKGLIVGIEYDDNTVRYRLSDKGREFVENLLGKNNSRKRYILKKDLPFAKAGTLVDGARSSYGTEKLSNIRIGNCKCDVPDGVNIFDWIEEVKPREFVMAIREDGVGSSWYSDTMYENLHNGTFKEVIKVREVIE